MLGPGGVFITLLVLASFCYTSVESQTCPSCVYYTFGLQTSGNPVLRGRETVAEILSVRSTLQGVSFDMKPAQEACTTYAEQSCGTNANCTTIEGVEGYFLCSCKEGNFEEVREDAKYSCEDVDECLDPSLNECSSDASCVNNPGSYQCICEDGFTGDGYTCEDIDECEVLCQYGECYNFPGGFNCTCDDGYNENGGECSDIDECELGVDECLMDQNCTNTMGSYTCTCVQDGYAWNGTACADIDECEELCQHGECQNFPGGFNCTCYDGYTESDGYCLDIDECELGLDECEVDHECINTEGGYTCGCVQDGYEWNGTACVDTDECEELCQLNGECNNFPGGFNCTCYDGYINIEGECLDVDECEEYPEVCGDNGSCENTDGTYYCECDEGYAWTDTMAECDDIDECEEMCQYGDCQNFPGGFNCTCDEGYTYAEGECVDVIECEETCQNGECVNILGTLECQCYSGYEKQEGRCVAVADVLPSPDGISEELRGVIRSFFSTWMKHDQFKRGAYLMSKNAENDNRRIECRRRLRLKPNARRRFL